jgi:hypothetical protein
MQLTDMAIRALLPDALDSYVSALAKLEPQLAMHGLNGPITCSWRRRRTNAARSPSSRRTGTRLNINGRLLAGSAASSG